MSLWAQDNAETKFTFEDNVLEILKRAKGFQSGEGVSFLESESNVREEVTRRGAKAGYCTRDGNPTFGTKIMGPGIGQSKLNQWPRNPITGELLDD